MAVILALMLTVSVVYAAFAGALTFQGTVTLSPETNLIFVSNDSRAYVSADGQIVTFTIELDTPADNEIIPLEVVNSGNTTVKIADFIRDYEGSTAVEITGHDVLLGETLNAGASIIFAMTFGLYEADSNSLDTQHNFKFMLDYEMVP